MEICKIRGFGYFFFEAMDQWVLCLLSIERAVAIGAPLFARRYINQRVAVFALLAIFFINLFASIPAWITYEIYPNAAYKSGFSCLPITSSRMKSIFFVFITVFNAWTYSTIATLSVTIYLLIKIAMISKQRKSLQSSSTANVARVSSKELNGAITVVALATVQTLLYLPTSISWNIYFAIPIFEIKLAPQTITLIVSAGRFFVMVTLLSHIWNFFWYYFRIPNFKRDLCHIIRLKPYEIGRVQGSIIISSTHANFRRNMDIPNRRIFEKGGAGI